MNDMQHDLGADSFALTGAERQIWAHEQVGELGPFSRPELILQFSPACSGAALTAAAERMIAAHPAFATRLLRLPGGEMRRQYVTHPGAVPEALAGFARDAVQAALQDPLALGRVLGEYLTEPKASVWFAGGKAPRTLRGVVLDRRTRMMHDARHIFINGESYRAAGRDAALMRTLADERGLSDAQVAAASADARELLRDWCESGWVHPATGVPV